MSHLFKLMGLLGVLMLAACNLTSTEPPTPTAIQPLQIVTEAAENIRATESFRMQVERSGAPYFIVTDLGNVIFRRAVAQYVAPNVMQATVRLLAGGLPIEVDVFSRGENQWYRNSILTADVWFNAPFSPGFNPEALIARETGFQASLGALIDMRYVGETTLESGAPVHHIAATANGPDVTALLANLIEMNGTVEVEVYVHRETRLPVRFVIRQPDTATAEEPEPTTWTIDMFAFNEPPEIEDPELDPNTVPMNELTAEPTP